MHLLKRIIHHRLIPVRITNNDFFMCVRGYAIIQVDHRRWSVVRALEPQTTSSTLQLRATDRTFGAETKEGSLKFFRFACHSLILVYRIRIRIAAESDRTSDEDGMSEGPPI
jgi:hypothetical protein